MKYLLVLIVVGVGLWMLAARFRKPRDPRDTRDRRDPSKSTAADGAPHAAPRDGAGAGTGTAKAEPGQMVACRHCGVHLPAEEAVFDGQLPYCGPSHRQAGPR
jgi:uncharacterized protein